MLPGAVFSRGNFPHAHLSSGRRLEDNHEGRIKYDPPLPRSIALFYPVPGRRDPASYPLLGQRFTCFRSDAYADGHAERNRHADPDPDANANRHANTVTNPRPDSRSDV